MQLCRPSSRLAAGVRFSPIRRDSAATPGRTQMKRQIDVVRVVGTRDVLSVYSQGLVRDEVPFEDASVETEQRNVYFSNNAPEWTELKTLMEREGELLGDPSLTQSDYLETGPPNALSLKRTFGKSDPIRVKLYRDQAAWCPFCQKVWIQLEEKQIPYTVEMTNLKSYGEKSESFLEKAPSGIVPVIELDGKVITESTDIALALEDEFPENPLLPPKGTVERGQCEEVFRLIETEQEDFEQALGKVEEALASRGGPFFLGEQFSLADISAVLLERLMDVPLVFNKGVRVRGEGRYPYVEAWFAAMEARPTYIATKADYYTIAFTVLPLLKDSSIADEGKKFAETIFGKNGAWSLPLEPLSANSFEPYSPGDNPRSDRYHAAKRLISNHEAVVKFALRACGKEIDRKVTSPLANPTAQPGMHAFTETDTAIRHIAHALLVGVDDKQTQSSKIVTQAEPENSMLPSTDAVLSLRYLRDRIGVPRDLKFPEARQLRAHVNWMIDLIS